MSTGNDAFQLVSESGWSRGLSNLLRGELSTWFGSFRWLRQTLMWLGIINLIFFFTLIGTQEAELGEEGPETLMLYGVFAGLFVAFGVMIIMQNAIVGEKKSGTAAWVLSKPVTRTAFIISRLVGNAVGILVATVLIPAIVAYITIGLMSPLGWLSPLNFLIAIAIFAVHVIFWLTLTLMMGTFFESTGGVIAVPMALLFGQWFLGGIIPGLIYISPLILVLGPGDEFSGVAVSVMNGEAPFSWIPLISALIFSLIFTAVAIWRFNRQEF